MSLIPASLKCIFIGHAPSYPLQYFVGGEIQWTCLRCGKPCMNAGYVDPRGKSAKEKQQHGNN